MMDGDGHHDGGGDDGFVRRNDVEKLREMQLSIAASSSVFPGFRFSPTDDELISYYLKKKLQGNDSCVDIIPEVDFCRHEPWDLPALSIIQSENEWFFFSTRGKKYPNGSQSKRATQSGYWKATGKERNVKAGGVTIGTKRTLVFHTGRAPRGERTEWIMHEYCMSDTSQESLVVCRLRRNGDFRLTESSKGSNDLRNLSPTDNAHYSGSNENANIQRDGSDEGNPMKSSCSKDSISSYISHSVEQIESESDSDRQLILHESTHGSSSPYKDTIRTILAFAAQQGQPQGFEIQRMEEKVYRLRKALYGVKRAPRAWSDKEEELFIVLVYVGDLIITGTTLSLIEKFKTSIKSEFEMFNMEDCNGVKNPIAPGFKLVKDDHSGHVNATLYMEAPIEQHMAALKRVLRYIHETSSFGVCYKKRGRDHLVAFSDNDYAGDYDNRRSTPGYVCFLSGAVVAWVRLSRRPVEAAQGFNFSVVTTLVSISAGFFAPRIFFKDNVPSLTNSQI
ncbi:NAC domain-containing protein [Tanacetum coccineum]